MTARRFLIVGRQRSGTTATQAVLRGHPDVATPPFEVRAEAIGAPLRALSWDRYGYEMAQAAAPRIFDTLAGLPHGREARWVGLKAALPTPEEAIDLCNGLREFLPDVHVVFVHRADLVAQSGSMRRAQRTGEWQGRADGKRSDVRIRLNPRTARRFFESAHRIDAQLRTLRDTHAFHEVSYDDHVTPNRYDDLFAFLGLQDDADRERVPRKASPPARDYIRNYDQLSKLASSGGIDGAAARAEADERLVEASNSHPPGFLIGRAAWLAPDRPDLARAILQRLDAARPGKLGERARSTLRDLDERLGLGLDLRRFD